LLSTTKQKIKHQTYLQAREAFASRAVVAPSAIVVVAQVGVEPEVVVVVVVVVFVSA
jgi:hypothetical protein